MRPVFDFEIARFMRVLLRQITTNLFYVGEGQWTYESETAKDFETLAEAERCAIREKLEGMELVLLNKHPHWEAFWPLKSR